MKRLLKKAIQTPEMNFVPLKELDQADIKLDRCPQCKGSGRLKKIDGYKVCSSCHSVYKVFDGEAYLTVN